MDPELINLINQLDTAVNGLTLQPNIDPYKIRTIQDSNAQIHQRLIDFKAQINTMENSFKEEVKSLIESLHTTISELQRNTY